MKAMSNVDIFTITKELDNLLKAFSELSNEDQIKEIEEKIKEVEKAIGRKLTNVEKNAIKRIEE